MNEALLILLATTAFATGFVKGGFGLGAGVLLTPFLSLFIPPFTAIILMSLLLLLSDLDGIRRYHKEWNVQEVRSLLPWGLIGTFGGLWLLPIIPKNILQYTIAVIAMFVVFRQLLTLISPPQASELRTGVPPSRWVRPTIGTSSGLIGYLSGSGGVILSMYLIRLTKRRERTATLLALLTLLDTIRVALYGIMGYYTVEILINCLICIPFLYIGAVLGEYVNGKLSDRIASYVFSGLLGMISLTLLIQ